MKKALISVLVLMALATVVTPVAAASMTPPSHTTRTSTERTQTQITTNSDRTQNRTPSQSPLRQRTPLTATNTVTTTSSLTGATAATTTVPTVVTSLTETAPVTGTAPLVESAILTPTGGVTATAPVDDAALDASYNAILAGTIIANRVDVPIRFFVDGSTFEVAPLRSIGLDLPRDTAVLNLFNCEATKSDTDAGCFWDPYLLTRDGFYEVIIGQQLGEELTLSLRAAGAPPADQIWIQNRTGERETVIVNNELYEVPPAAVQEFTVVVGAPVIVQLRTCIEAGEQSICEWAPQGVEAGFYYGLVRNDTPGPENTQLTSLALQGVIASSGETVKAPPQALCRLRVPTLNVRSGPGLEFPIIAKIRGTESEPGSVVVVGFDATQTWMQVTERVAREGWVTSNPEFILCEGDLAALPVAGQVAAAEATPAPEAEAPAAAESTVAVAATEAAPEVVEAAPVEVAPVVEETTATEESAPAAEAAPVEAETPAEEEATPTPQVAEVPDGLARLVVNNPFDQVIRFTLDQKYRPERENLNGEWDMQPGDQISILVYPGTVAFSVSTPWRGLADNAEIVVAEKEERALWIWFVPDPVEPDRWNLQF